MVITLILHPGATIAIALAVMVVIAAVAVDWNDIRQMRAPHVNKAELRQGSASAQPNVTVPGAPGHIGRYSGGRS
jgi:hypothetical protein